MTQPDYGRSQNRTEILGKSRQSGLNLCYYGDVADDPSYDTDASDFDDGSDCAEGGGAALGVTTMVTVNGNGPSDPGNDPGTDPGTDVTVNGNAPSDPGTACLHSGMDRKAESNSDQFDLS